MRRPLAVFCLIFLVVAGLSLWLKPPQFHDFTEAEGMECRVIGQVDKIEYKSIYGQKQTVLYLKQISYFHVIQEQIFKDNFNDNLNENLSDNSKEKFQSDNQINMPEGLVCYLGKSEALEPKIGSMVLVEGEFQNYARATNPGEFDARLYYRILGLDGRIKGATLKKTGEDYDRIAEFQFQIRLFLEQKLQQIYPEKEAGIMLTMLLGNKAELDKDVKNLYQLAGILHILSVSGLHVSALGYGFYRVLRKVGIPMRVSAITAIVWMWFYGGMIGMGVSAFRAVVMFSLRMSAQWWGRTYDLLTALAVAAVLLIGSEPLYFYHSGFWLSFTCVLAISLLYPCLQLKEKERGSKKVRVINSWLVSVSVTILTLPVFLWFYYEVSLWGILWNLVVVPLTSIVLGGGIINICLPGWAEGLSRLVAKGNCVVLGFFEGLCRISEATGQGNLILGKPEWWQILLFAGGMIVFMFLAKKLKYYFKILFLTLLVFVVVLRIPTGFQMTVLDVGQGDGICVQNANGNVYFVDGGSSDKSSVGTYQILPFLKYQGIRNVNAVFLSHGDEDHISGIKELLEMQRGGVRIEKVVLPDLEETLLRQDFGEIITLCKENNTQIYTMQKGNQFVDEKLILTCLHPIENYVGESNASSQVLKLDYGSFSALLTGDVEETGEVQLQQTLAEYGIDNITLLKVAHHGSKYSSKATFLSQINPRVSIISCGKGNRYGHPHAETLKRLEQSGSKILLTSECGAITVELKEGVKVYGFVE